MFLKAHILHAHLDRFMDNMSAYSEELGEGFHEKVNLNDFP